MPSWIIYADVNDFQITLQNIDWQECREGFPYMYRNASEGSNFLNLAAAFDGFVNYTCRQGFQQYDTSAVTGALVSASLNLIQIGTTWPDQSVEARLHDWPDFIADAPDPASFIPASEMSSKTLIGRVATGTGLHIIPWAPADIPRVTTLRIVLYMGNQFDDVEPVDGSPSIRFVSANTAGTTSDPYLSIVTSTGGPPPGAGRSFAGLIQ